VHVLPSACHERSRLAGLTSTAFSCNGAATLRAACAACRSVPFHLSLRRACRHSGMTASEAGGRMNAVATLRETGGGRRRSSVHAEGGGVHYLHLPHPYPPTPSLPAPPALLLHLHGRKAELHSSGYPMFYCLLFPIKHACTFIAFPAGGGRMAASPADACAGRDAFLTGARAGRKTLSVSAAALHCCAPAASRRRLPALRLPGAAALDLASLAGLASCRLHRRGLPDFGVPVFSGSQGRRLVAVCGACSSRGHSAATPRLSSVQASKDASAAKPAAPSTGI